MTPFNPDEYLASVAPQEAPVEGAAPMASPEEGFNPDAFLAEERKQERYGTPTQQAITGLEGALSSATFGLSTGVETLAGVDPRNIRARQEVNPGTHLAGEAAGLLSPGGPLKLLESAGARVARAAMLGKGLERSAPIVQRMGAQAVNQAVQGALVQSGNEVHKMFAQDPTQSFNTALSNVGTAAALSGGLGGALTGVGGLASKGTERAKSYLTGIKDRMQNSAGLAEVSKLEQEAGVSLSDAARGAMTGDDAGLSAAKLKQSTSYAGSSIKSELDAAEKELGEAVLQSTGRESIQDISEHEIGSSLKDTMSRGLEAELAPISDAYEGVKGAYLKVPITADLKAAAVDRLSKRAIEEGYHLVPGSVEMGKIQQTVNALENVKTAEDLRKVMSVMGRETKDPTLFGVGRVLKQELRSVESDAIEAGLANSADALAAHKSAKASYKAMMDKLDALNDRLHVGKYSSPASFIRNLKDMTPESILRRSKGLADVEFTNMLKQSFPEAGKLVQDYNMSKLLKQSTTNGELSTRKFFSNYDKLSPELKSSMFSPEQSQQLDAARELLSRLPANINPSGTARTIEALTKDSALGAGGLVLGALTGSLLTGGAGAIAVRLFAKEGPDAVRLAILRTLGTTGEVSMPAFTALTSFAKQLADGHKLVKNATSAVFKEGVIDVLPASKIPGPAERSRLEKTLRKIATDPVATSTMVADTMGQYMDSESGAMGATVSRVLNFMNSIRPVEAKLGPLDPPAPLSAPEKAKYERALSIVEQPLLVLQHIKQGSLTTEDVITLNATHPEMAAQLRDRMAEQMVEHSAEGHRLPYKVAMSLSLFMGTPLESSLKPENIMANQSIGIAPQPQEPRQNAVVNQGQGKALNDLPKAAATGAQSRELDRSMRNK